MEFSFDSKNIYLCSNLCFHDTEKAGNKISKMHQRIAWLVPLCHVIVIIIGGSILSCCSTVLVIKCFLSDLDNDRSKYILKASHYLRRLIFEKKYPFLGTQQWNWSQYNCPLY